MAKYYSGIGSRETPEKVLELMKAVAEELAKLGYILRSGGAGGADTAFEKGCNNLKEIYIPWNGFQDKQHGVDGNYCVQNNPNMLECRRIAAEKHPAWSRCTHGAQNLHSRNVLQVLGQDIKTPSEFVLYYAKADKYGNIKGGTAMAVSIAKEHKVPTFNLLGKEDWPVEDILFWIGV